MKSIVKISLILIVGLGYQPHVFSQATAKIITNKSIKDAIDLKSVLVTSNTNDTQVKGLKATTDLRTDEVLQEMQGVTLIRRGNYAAEPTFRGMSAGQLSVTIDGMKIFGACTDKMDPVSSYVSANNLESISLSANSNRSTQGSNIGGGFDFQTKKPQFNNKKELNGSAGIGYQTNGNGRITDFNLNYGDSAWAINLNANYQKFDNYNASQNQEILYTQFEKLNVALSATWMISSNEILKAQLIYDDAYNVGYPALPMDVSFAGGRIYSLSYKKYTRTGFHLLKAYGNNITHIMDDTKRAFVPMHMDMPGKSDTYGAYLQSQFTIGKKHTLTINPDYYYNVSFADMTMYPNDPTRPEEPLMYMITWPDVKRHSGSVLISDFYQINTKSNLKFSGKLEYVTSQVFSDFGIKQLAAIGKNGTIPSNYLLANTDILYEKKLKNNWSIFGQTGYAERQPTVSEGFGYYLFNSMDGFDYVGSPDLKKEKAVKISAGTKWANKILNIESKVFHYQFQDYIIGNINPSYDGMTIGSNGVKIYENIPSASISGFEISLQTVISNTINIQNSLQYSYGLDNESNPLQMIPPLTNTTKIGYSKNKLKLRLEAILSAMQNNPRLNAGETATPSYGILNLHAQHPFKLFKQEWNASARINNLLDSYYWNHLDWNSLPRSGRSFVFRLEITF